MARPKYRSAAVLLVLSLMLMHVTSVSSGTTVPAAGTSAVNVPAAGSSAATSVPVVGSSAANVPAVTSPAAANVPAVTSHAAANLPSAAPTMTLQQQQQLQEQQQIVLLLHNLMKARPDLAMAVQNVEKLLQAAATFPDNAPLVQNPLYTMAQQVLLNVANSVNISALGLGPAGAGNSGNPMSLLNVVQPILQQPLVQQAIQTLISGDKLDYVKILQSVMSQPGFMKTVQNLLNGVTLPDGSPLTSNPLVGMVLQGLGLGPPGNGSNPINLLSILKLPPVQQALQTVLSGGQVDIWKLVQSLMSQPEVANMAQGLLKAVTMPDGSSNPLIGMVIQGVQPIIQQIVPEVLAEIQKGKLQAAANNITVGTDIGSLLSLVDPLAILQKVLAHPASLLFPRAQNSPISKQCYRDVTDTVDALIAGKSWAFDMVDALGKPAAGIQKGSFNYAGSYDQCYQTRPGVAKGPGTTTTISRQFGTRFCRVDIPVPEDLVESLQVDTKGIKLKVNWGVCVPDSCHGDDIMSMFTTGLNVILSQLNNNISIPIERVHCVEDREISTDSSAIVCVVILSIFGALIAMGTLYDVCKSRDDVTPAISGGKYKQTNGEMNGHTNEALDVKLDIIAARDGADQKTTEFTLSHSNGDVTDDNNSHQVETTRERSVQRLSKRKDSTLDRLLLCFSLYTNVPKLLNAKQSSGTVACIHGIRFLSMTWVVLGHTYNYGILSQSEAFTADNLVDFPPILARFTYQAIIAGGFAVDTFFVLSSFLLTWLKLKDTDKKKRKLTVPDAVMYYFHRFWRLTPIYMLVVMIFTCLYQYMGDGPFWPSRIDAAENCKTSWWTNLLYVNNLVNVDTQCMDWTWYLANDMQYYILSPLVLIAMYMLPVFGNILAVLVLAGGITASFTLEYHYNGSFFTMKKDGGDYWHYVYIAPWCRVGCWAIGMLLGYLVYKRGSKPINKPLSLLGWLLATGVALFIAYSPYSENKEGGTEWSVLERSFYESFGRPAWGLCVAWVIFACYTGRGGIVNSILSWNGFIPLSRLTYAAYLVHPICIMTYVFSKRAPLHVNDYNIIYLYFGHLGMTYMVAFAASLAFEAPFMALEKVLFRRGGHR